MVGLLESKRQAIVDACLRHGVARLEAFGSALREDFRAEQSDIDLLVEFKPMDSYGRVEAYFGLLTDLRQLLAREVDLVMAGAIKNRYVAREIERTKQVIYAA